MLKIFKLFQEFLNTKFAGQGFTYCMLLFFAACAVIDGPNIIQALTGEDAGLQSGYQKIMAVYNAGKGMKDKTVGHVANATREVVAAHRHRQLKNAMTGRNKKNSGAGSTGAVLGYNSSSAGQEANANMKSAMHMGSDVGKESENQDINTAAMGENKNSEKPGEDANRKPSTKINAANVGTDSNRDIKNAMNKNSSGSNLRTSNDSRTVTDSSHSTSVSADSNKSNLSQRENVTANEDIKNNEGVMSSRMQRDNNAKNDTSMRNQSGISPLLKEEPRRIDVSAAGTRKLSIKRENGSKSGNKTANRTIENGTARSSGSSKSTKNQDVRKKEIESRINKEQHLKK